jgi:hypothetical protein
MLSGAEQTVVKILGYFTGKEDETSELQMFHSA